MGGYRRATLGALVDALLPRTPELAATLGPEHVTGGTDVGLAEYLVEAFDGYQEHHLGPLSTLLRRFGVRNYPYSLLVALLLDVVAVELLVPESETQAQDAARDAGFERAGTGPQFEGEPTTRYRLE